MVTQESELAPLKLTSDTLSELGKNPATKVRRAFVLRLCSILIGSCSQATVVSLPTIESSFVNHTTKAIRGFDHPEFPALRVALEVLNATESFLWVGELIASGTESYLLHALAFYSRLWSCVWRLHVCRQRSRLAHILALPGMQPPDEW
jgi:hypothetical protein